MRAPLLCLLAVLFVAPLRAVEPQPQGERRKPKSEGASGVESPLPPSSFRPSHFFRPGDVVALVGGEDMVVASEYGYLELLLTRALPEYRLRFRNLAWEGDTVFEQRRDLNFPTWEEQLDKIGATVVICQFGKMVSLGNRGRMKPGWTSPEAARADLPGFAAVYQKLIERFRGAGSRRIVILSPFFPSLPEHRRFAATLHLTTAANLAERTDNFFAVGDACQQIGLRTNSRTLNVDLARFADSPFRSDGVHLSEGGHRNVAQVIATELCGAPQGSAKSAEKSEPLRQLIIAKNRLWFDYWRPQNWAFLAGDRTAQPSSRDHLDPSKRWFPPEREAFLPLIEAKEKEIDALAEKLARP